jgi:hypothetical protein
MKRVASLTLGVALLAALAPSALRPASACAPAFREKASVRIAAEDVLIIWDAKAKMQHFIRLATFDTETPDFGFLVPTPTQPYPVTEAPEEVFADLAEWTKPEVVVRKVRRPPPGAKSAPDKEKKDEVRVLDSGRVGNLLYDILKAKDPKALADWLKKNKYATRPALEKWLKRYTDNEWVITAFKIIKDKTAHRAAPKGVRMSFKTDKPFHPYREPADLRKKGAAHPPRLLRVYFIGPERVKGSLGLAKPKEWPGRTVWANQIEKKQVGKLTGRLEMEKTKLPDRPWLTVFEDSSSPRPGTHELYFTATDPDVVKRPPIERIEYVDDPGEKDKAVEKSKPAEKGKPADEPDEPVSAQVKPPVKGLFSGTVGLVLIGSMVGIVALLVFAWWLSRQSDDLGRPPL